MVSINISFAGAGRVASTLSREMRNAGHRIEIIVSPGEEKGKAAAESCGALWSHVPSFPRSTDLIIVAITDSRLTHFLHTMECHADTIVAHTAGSYGLEVFPDKIKRKAVFYPLQTFSEGRRPDFHDLPFLLESSDRVALSLLDELAASLGGKSYFVTPEQRKMLHVAAVFVCNFTNYMLTSGKRVSGEAGLPFGLLHPLLNETVLKAIEAGPERSQTGPAIRNDMNTIEKHLELLSFSPELRKLYSDITESIIKHYNK